MAESSHASGAVNQLLADIITGKEPQKPKGMLPRQ